MKFKKLALTLAALGLIAGTTTYAAENITGDVTFGTEMESWQSDGEDADEWRYAPFVAGGFNFSENFRLGYTMKQHFRENEDGASERRSIMELYPKFSHKIGDGWFGAEVQFKEEVDAWKNRKTMGFKPSYWYPLADNLGWYSEIMFGNEPNYEFGNNAGDGSEMFEVAYTEYFTEFTYTYDSNWMFQVAGKFKTFEENLTDGELAKDGTEVYLFPKVQYNLGGNNGNVFYRMEIGKYENSDDYEETKIRYQAGHWRPIKDNLSMSVEAFLEDKYDKDGDKMGTNRFLAAKLHHNF